jgi:hypothetical protein
MNLARARELGLDAISANIYSDDLTDNIELSDAGYLLAMTGNDEINKQAINRFGKQFGETGTFRLMTPEELKNNTNLVSQELFSHTHDYIKLSEVASNFPSIQEIPIDTHKQFMRLLGIIEDDDNAIALFLKKTNGFLDIISAPENMEVTEDCHLVYLGKPMDFEDVMHPSIKGEQKETKNKNA